MMSSDRWSRLAAAACAVCVAAAGFASAHHKKKRAESPAVESTEDPSELLRQGIALRDAGDLDRAEPILKRALELDERLYGANDPRTADALTAFGELRFARGDVDGAEASFARSLDVHERTLGPGAEETALSASDLGACRYARGDLAGAEKLFLRALESYVRGLGPDPVAALDTIDNLGAVTSARGDFAASAGYFARALAVRKRFFGPEHPASARSMTSLGEVLTITGDLAEAGPLLEHALSVDERALGPDDPATLAALADLGAVRYQQARYPEADALFVRALAGRERAFGPDDPATVSTLGDLARVARASGRYAEAESRLLRALALDEKARPEEPDTASVMLALGGVYELEGATAKAEPLYVRAAAIYEKSFGPDDARMTEPLRALGSLHAATADYELAESELRRGLDLAERTLGPDHHMTLGLQDVLANVAEARGEPAEAESLLVRALATRERVSGADDPATADALSDLAAVYVRGARYSKAEPLLVRSLAIYTKALGPDHASTASAENRLAILYAAQGDFARAEAAQSDALASLERALGPEHPSVGDALASLARLEASRGDADAAERDATRALAISEKANGPDHPRTADALVALASLYQSGRDFAKAEPLLRRALAIDEARLGRSHRDTARACHDLALVEVGLGKYAEAEPLFDRAAAICETALGPNHPDLAVTLGMHAECALAAGRLDDAIALRRRAEDVRERDFARNLVAGSERDKLAYLALSGAELDDTVSMSLRDAPTSRAAAELALETVLRRKGRALDVMADTVAKLRGRASAEDRALLDALDAARRRLSGATLGAAPEGEDVAAHRARLDALASEVERLERDASRRSAELRASLEPVDLPSVARAVPTDARLVEYVAYRPFDPRSLVRGAARYGAYVLDSTGRVRWADLGAADAIDRAVARFRSALRDPHSDVRGAVRPLARALYDRVFGPVAALSGESRRLLVSPDGTLNLLPFDALVDATGRYVVERYELSYLTSGRDLLRLGAATSSRSPAEIVADPDFGPAPPSATGGERLFVQEAASTAAANGDVASVLARAYFPPLAGTRREAERIVALVPGARALTGAQATKDELERATAPQFLHIATHGFFLDDGAAPASSRAAPRLLEHEAVAAGATPVNPLLRSGLALSGANRHDASGDGIFTALEAAGLDLWGTKLVVLSACDTGVGEVRTGDGVYGLRRAFVLAGSETQVMSLWPVSDVGTSELMSAYYTALLGGAGRSAAMRTVRLRMLADPERAHPYFWASFIVSGEWAGLDGRRLQATERAR